ncbi:MAG TPA: protein kinase [Polyangiaceae bacterium]
MAQGSGPGGALAFGRYELRVELARSQLGSLWVAKPPDADSGPALVCVRRLRTGPPLSADDAQRLTEAAWASLPVRHASVLSVLDVVVTEDELGVVSEYVESEPVRSLLRLPSFRRKPLSSGLALLIAGDILEALEAVFNQTPATPSAPRLSGGLSPDSVLLGTDGRARLTDLGIASILKAIPKFASHPDLAAYAPPEQLAFSKELDERSEIFTLGVLVWELITGRRLFVAATHAAVSEKVRSEEIARLDAARPFGGEPVPKAIADLVARALEREPAARFGSLAEMRAGIDAVSAAVPGSREDLGRRVSELASNTFAARSSALATAAAAADAGLPPASRGALLSSAPPKAKRPLHKQTLLGVAPPMAAQAGARRPSRPPSTPLPPPSFAPEPTPEPPPPSSLPNFSRRRGPGRSPTLLGVAPPPAPVAAANIHQTVPIAPAPVSVSNPGQTQPLEPLDLDDMRPSRPPFNGNEPAAPAASTGITGWNALMAGPENESAVRVPSLESPSAFDFMADRHDDNVATVPRSRDFGVSEGKGATLPHGSPLEAPEAQAYSLPNTHSFSQPEAPAWAPPPPPSSVRVPVPSAAPPLQTDAASAEFAPRPSAAPTRRLEPDEVPLVAEASSERTRRLRRVVAGVVAATAALLVCALVIAALRRDDTPDTPAAATDTARVGTAPSAAMPKAAAPVQDRAQARDTTSKAVAGNDPAGRSATPAAEASASAAASAGLVADTDEDRTAKPAAQKRLTVAAKPSRAKQTAAAKKAAAKAAAAKKAAAKKSATKATKTKSKTTKRAATKKTPAKKTK